MLIFYATFLTLGLTLGAKISLEAGKSYTFTSKNYPQMNNEKGSAVYEYTTNPGSQIIVLCTDFRTIVFPNPCEKFSMTLSDGVKTETFCETRQKPSFRTSGSSLKVEMKYEVSALASCTVRSTEDPVAEMLVVEPGQSLLIETSTEMKPFSDKAWTVRSSNGEDVTLDCIMDGYSEPPCNDVIIILGKGSDRQEHCGRNEVSLKNKELFVRVAAGSYGQGFLRCYASVEDVQPSREPKPSETPKEKPSASSHFVKKGEMVTFSIGSQNQKIDIETEADNNLHIFCNSQFYVGSGVASTCSEIEVDVDGKKYCENQYLSHFSSGPTVKITSRFQYERDIECRAISKPELREVTLKVSDGVFTVGHPPEHSKDYNQGWRFKAADNTKLSIQCDISTTSFVDQTVCTEAVVRINDGFANHEICGAKRKVFISKSTEIELVVQVLKKSHGSFYCDIQAITGPNPNQIDNLEIIDSAEDAGLGRGKMSTTCDCGRRYKDSSSKRIFYGQNTTEGEYPWMVGIRDSGNWQRCGGSIITPYHVLTAAHCMTNSKVRKKYELHETIVYVGAFSLYEDASHGKTKGVAVKRTFIPEEWWDFKKNYDIAVLHLAEKLEFSKHVMPVCLTPSHPHLLHSAIKAIGWGQTEHGYAAPELLQTKLFVKARSQCTAENHIICTVNKKSSVCFGDSGGPLAYLDEDTNLYTQVGVASYVTSGNCDAASGFANVTFFWNYIMDCIKETEPSAMVCQKRIS